VAQQCPSEKDGAMLGSWRAPLTPPMKKVFVSSARQVITSSVVF
jgi:hypothetical protein